MMGCARVLDGVVHTLIDLVVDRKGGRGAPRVKMIMPCLLAACMIWQTDFGNLTYVRVTCLLLANMFVRLLYPSAYFPASASVPGVFAHPLTARLIAFAAEFGLYEVWANWIGLDFWSNNTLIIPIWIVVLVGEVLSTVGVVLQMELLLVLEDSTWALHTMLMCFLGFPARLPVLFFGGFFVVLLFYHLPRRFQMLFARQRSQNKESSIFELNPLFGLHRFFPTSFLSKNDKNGMRCLPDAPNYVQIRPCKLTELSWVVPMLLAQPVLTAYMYYSMKIELKN